MASKPRLISLLSLLVVAATLAFAQDSNNDGAKSQVFRYQQQARIDVGRRRLLPGQSGPQEKRLGRRSSNLGLQKMGAMPASGGLYRRAYNDERDGMDAAGLISGGATDIKNLKCLNILGFESKVESGTMGLRVWGDGSWLPVESLEISLSHPGSDDTQTARVHLDTVCILFRHSPDTRAPGRLRVACTSANLIDRAPPTSGFSIQTCLLLHSPRSLH